MPKYTPGPWSAERGNAGLAHPLFVVAPGEDGIRPWRDADARLIAAAPEMYEALKAYQRLDEARCDCDECGGEYEPEACGTCMPLADDARCKMRAAIAKVESGDA